MRLVIARCSVDEVGSRSAAERTAEHRDPEHDGTVPRIGRPAASDRFTAMRLVIARCSVDYVGRLTAHLPMAPRLLMVKADGCVAIHADGGAYKPLNWMNAPCTIARGATALGGDATPRARR